ncbi:MAG: L-myo-inositol-1-phosphate synthase, partial [Candidatus Korarchaeota archaeon]
MATDSSFTIEFEKAGVPIAGDDLQSQIGGTILHRELLHFLNSRGVRIVTGYQLDISGSTETIATLDWLAKQRKREIKSKIVQSELPYNVDIVTGTTDYVKFMGDTRTSYFYIEGEYAYGGKFTLDAYMTTSDGANAVNILLDIVRALKIAKDRKIGGALIGASAYAFKNPPVKMRADEAERWFFEFVNRFKER